MSTEHQPTQRGGELVERLRSDGSCPFCGRDPYHYVNNGVGMERVAVTCCEMGIALFQDGDEQLSAVVCLMNEAADAISTLEAERDEARKERDEARAKLEEAEEALHVIATMSGREVDEPAHQIELIVDAGVECASNALQSIRRVPHFNPYRARAESAEATVERLREGLKPFAAVADEYDDAEDDSHEVWIDAGPIRNIRSTFELAKFRRARALLQEPSNG